MTTIDIDAILGEQEPKTLTYKGQDYTLPAELPAVSLAPFFARDLGLTDIVADVITANEGDEDWIDTLLGVLRKRPTLPLELVGAAKSAFSDLLDDGYTEPAEDEEGTVRPSAEFFATRPSVNAYFAIARVLMSEYAVSLRDFFGSPTSLPAGGETSSSTSEPTSDSTPEASGDAPESPAS